MNGVLRTWLCQNVRCGHSFDAWSKYPECPECGCNRTQWVPGGGHIGNMAKNVDATFRDLAASYGMSDIADARAGERAMPKLKQPPAAEIGPQHQFAPGFVGTAYTRDARGEYRAVCEPSAVKVNFKVTAQTGRKLPRSGVPGAETNARLEGSYKG